MFLQEINAYGLIVKKILQSKKPIVIYFYNQKNTKMIILDRVNLQTVRNRKGEIVSFKNPTWGNNGSEKFKPENLK